MHSGLLCVDLDNLNGNLDAIRKKLELDKHVFALFTSPTGAGLKVIVPIEADAVKHDESFKDAQHYFKDTYDIDVDQSCRNPSRLCYVSYDPEMFSRPNAEIIPQRPPNVYKELTRRFGDPYLSNGKGNIQINQMFFVGRFGIEHLVLHEPNERDFYTYTGQSGAWVPRTTDSIKAMFSEDWQRYAHQVDEPALLTLRTNSLLENFTSLLRGHVEKPEAFQEERQGHSSPKWDAPSRSRGGAIAALLARLPFAQCLPNCVGTRCRLSPIQKRAALQCTRCR